MLRKHLFSLFFSFCLLGCSPTLKNPLLEGANSFSLEKFSTSQARLKKLFLHLPQSTEATVGVLPFYRNESGELYVLIGQESSGKDRGTFSDFGGSFDWRKDKDIFSGLARELREETMGCFNLDAKDIQDRGYFFIKTNPKTGRQIFLACILLEKNAYVSRENLLALRTTLQKSPHTPLAELEKKDYVWLKATDLLASLSKNNICIQDIEKTELSIPLRPHFNNDWIQNPDFQDIIYFLMLGS